MQKKIQEISISDINSNNCDIQQQVDIMDPLLLKQSKLDSQILPDIFSNCFSQKSLYLKKTNTKGTSRISRKDKNKSAAQRYRERRKAQTQNLQKRVNQIEQQMKQSDEELKQVKQKLQAALSVSKNANQHSETYNELLFYSSAQQFDLDKINLLLDTIKYRIGANCKERQAKIDYNFKQIVNTVFPALHRYLMYTAEYNFDFFSSSNHKLQWTKQIFNTLPLTQDQINKISNYKDKLINMREDTKKSLGQLDRLKKKLKDEQEIVQNILDDLRLQMHPIQSAQMILFSQKHKYRRCIGIEFDEPFSQQPRKIRKF